MLRPNLTRYYIRLSSEAEAEASTEETSIAINEDGEECPCLPRWAAVCSGDYVVRYRAFCEHMITMHMHVSREPVEQGGHQNKVRQPRLQRLPMLVSKPNQ